MSVTAPEESTESLWAALDPNDEGLRELVYSTTSGVYIRSGGAWFKTQDDDISLDGLEAIDVDEEFIEVFDEADRSGRALSRDDVLKHEVASEDNEDEDEE